MSETDGGAETTLDQLMTGVREDVRRNHSLANGGPMASGEESVIDARELGGLTVEEVMARVRTEIARRQRPQPEVLVGAVASAGVQPQPVRWHPSEPRLEPRGEYRLDELLRFDDADFVETAYRALLRRPPDQAGCGNYLSVLRGGYTSKIEILGSIRFSEEGRKCGVHVDGLLLPYKLHQWRHKRLIGPVLGFAMGVFWLPRVVFRLQAMEATAARESHEMGRVLNNLDADIRNFRGDLNQSTLARMDALRALSVWVESVQDLAETHARQSQWEDGGR